MPLIPTRKVRRFLIASIFVGLLTAGCRENGLSVLFYNVQNLFDASLDGTEYRDFASPEGWNEAHVKKRLAALAKVIRSAPTRPRVVGLSEVENAAILRRLNQGYLDGYPYEVLAPDPDAAVRIGVLSEIRPTEVRAHRPSFPGSRSMLELRLPVDGAELVLFVCHWKSRLGGARETEPARIQAARLLASRIREIKRPDSSGAVVPITVVVGDLNVAPNGKRSQDGTYPRALWAGDQGLVGLAGRPPIHLHSPWLARRDGGLGPPGTYFFRGEWEAIDQVLADPELVDGIGWELEEFKVLAPEFALDDDGRPLAWDTRRLSGYSDHLPVFFRIGVKPKPGGDD